MTDAESKHVANLVGYGELLDKGRMANVMFEMAGTVGLARRHDTNPVFGPADLVYRPIWSTPDEWWPDPYPADAVPAPRLASHLSPFARWYLQDLSLFVGVADEVRSVFRLAPAATAEVGRVFNAAGFDRAESLCVVHVRRGDTATRNPPETINPLPVGYYVDAVEATGRGSVAVFSDDPDWCRSELPDSWRVMDGVPGPEDNEPDFKTRPRADWVDMYLMARLVGDGAALVMSNSVFAWWAAWLNDVGDDRVVVPSKWYGRRLLAKGCDAERILLPGWRRVSPR